MNGAMSTLLEGVRVVEAGTFIAGPFAALMLADLGAQVTKVEALTGDPAWRFGLKHRGLSALGFNLNRGKRSERVDLKTDAGHRRILELLQDADVFIQNWRPGVADGLGLGPAATCGRFDQLIYISVTGFGSTGPRSKGPVFDTLLQAATGLATYEGDADGPRLARSYLVDKVTAMFATQAMLAALLARARTGRGDHYEVSMLDSMAYFNFPDLAQHRTFLDYEPQLASGRTRAIATSDGWIAIAPVRGSQLAATATAFGHGEWVADLKAIQDPAAVIETLIDRVAPIVATMTTRECETILTQASVPVMPVLTFDEHLTDAQTSVNHLYSSCESPVGPARRVRHPLAVDRESNSDVEP